MNNFLPIKRNYRAAPLRLAARIISIMILAFLWPVRGGAQESTSDLNVSSISDKLTLTYKLKSGSTTDYAWHYKAGEGNETEFSGKLTGTNNSWSHGAIDIKSEKAIADTNNLDSYPILKLDGLNLTSTTADGSLFYLEGSKPFCIQATGNSASNLKAKKDVINNYQGCILLLDGGTAGLNIAAEGTGSYGIYLYSTSSAINTTLKGKITVTAEAVAVFLDNLGAFSATEDAKVTVSSEDKDGDAIYGSSRVKSPFLQWQFATAPTSGQTLEVKDASGQSFDPAIQFTTDGKKKGFAINVTKNTGYTLWLGNEQLMDSKGTTVFTATEDKLVSFSGMTTLPTDWAEYAQVANVGTDGTDVAVAVSGTTYTVKTARGLAWIAWVTNNGKTTADADKTYSDSYPPSEGFKDCTVTLADDISLAKPAQGVASGFEANWIPIGTYKDFDARYYFQGTFDGGGRTITGMMISSTSEYSVGLFGYLYEATVQNLTMAKSNNINLTTTSKDDIYIGSIAGQMAKGKIINCHNQCQLKCSDKKVGIGGIVGATSNNSVLSACSNSGAVTIEKGHGHGGGIVAYNNSSTIVSCFNTGEIKVNASDGAAYAGGIVGYSMGSNSISHCYSTGDIIAKSPRTAYSGGIAGATGSTIGSCFATGTVSAESTDYNLAAAGGIMGFSNSNGNIQINNCLALTTGGVKASGSTSDNQQTGRIIGYDKNNGVTLSNNYASTNIKLTIGTTETAPTDNIGGDKANGANTYLDDVADYVAAWTGPEDTKAFTAIGIDANGLLPQLKAIESYDADGLPTAYASTIIPGQTTDLKSADYLATIDPLSLSTDNTDIITLSCSKNKWSYTKGEGGTQTRFNGTVKMDQDGSASTNKLVVSTVTDTGNSTLTLEKVEIKPTDGAALTIDEGCALTIHTTGDKTSTLTSSAASTLVNKGSLTLTGKGLYIGNTSATDTHYGLDNSGTFTVSDPAATSVTFHCAGTAIHNTGNGTLANAWMEWRFAEGSGQSDGKIAFAATDDDNQSPTAQLRQGKTYATTVTPGKTYRLWTVTNNGGEVRTPQKGLDSNEKPVKLFSAVANDVTVYTKVEELKTIEITDTKNFSEANCAAQDVVVKSNGVLTIDVADASIFKLTFDLGAQIVTTNSLKVSETFLTTCSLENKWVAFGSPIALTATVGENDDQLLYAATGYTATDAAGQGWKTLSGTDANAKKADLTSASPYLLAAEKASTSVTFAATAPLDRPLEIPAMGTVTLGNALADGTFLFKTNPNLANLTLSNIYVLNVDEKRFELKEGDYEVKPFEAFIVANAVTRARVAGLKIGKGIATGIEQPLTIATTRIWGTRGMLHIAAAAPADIVIVTPAGRLLRTIKVAVGDTTVALPAGIYFVRCNEITYKVSL